MSYKPIAPAPSSTPGSSTPGPGTPVLTAGSVTSPSGSVPGAAAPFRPLFNDFGPPSMGYVQAMKPPGAQGSQSTYTDLSVIEEMGKEIRPTYAGSKSAMERLKRAPTTQHLPRTSHHFVPDPFSPSRLSEGLSPPCLVSWAIASLFAVCLLLNMPFFCINKR
ncbi:PREDICTED: cyclin-dependent kinase 2-associated protein 2 isoform X1 [Myotis brandtii]|uniref:cyclin-dependent kinase 2-associated protein 2 isoform X1 n=1 Tax=Myotis brandtii TaxID=109478 RepID=UPI00070457A2|nr:PREDICTED: cyclin-dependent kinase 2-associated protein 2 isoform X1 [Myotis brandtii]